MLDGQAFQESPTTERHGRMSLAGSRLIASPYLSSEDRQALEDAALSARSISAGNELIREGERTNHFHIVIEGWICRYKLTREGSRQIVALLVPGDAANLDSFLFSRLNYGVRTLTPARIATISRDRILALAEQHTGVAKTLAWLAMIENAILSQWALRLGRQSAKQSLAHLLCEIATRLGVEEGDSFQLPLTQEQIADVLGLTAVHVNRMIQLLRTDDLIKTGGRAVTIVDAERLARVGEFDPAYLHIDRDSSEARSDRFQQAAPAVSSL